MASAKPTSFTALLFVSLLKSRAAELSHQTGGFSAALWWTPVKKTVQLLVYFLCQLTHPRELKLSQWDNLINVNIFLPRMQCVKLRKLFLGFFFVCVLLLFCQLFNSTFSFLDQPQEKRKYQVAENIMWIVAKIVFVSTHPQHGRKSLHQGRFLACPHTHQCLPPTGVFYLTTDDTGMAATLTDQWWSHQIK